MEVRLRQVEKEDLPQLRDWRNLYKIRSRTREYRLLNMVNQQEWFEFISTDRNTDMFGIEVGVGKDFGEDWKLVGVCGLCPINWVNRTAEISIYIGDRDYWRKGIGSIVLLLLKIKAFTEYNLRKLYAEVYANNYPSMQLFETNGYTKEAALREHVFTGGHYQDSIIYALFREGKDEN